MTCAVFTKIKQKTAGCLFGSFIGGYYVTSAENSYLVNYLNLG